MIDLDLCNPHWINDEGDDPNDQCAHGGIALTVDDVPLVLESDGEWTVSAAALFLLRSVTADHIQGSSVSGGNYLIPCCGHYVCPWEKNKYGFEIMGCPNGIDLGIQHDKGLVRVWTDDHRVSVSLRDWAGAGLQFSDRVQSFYDSCAKKLDVSAHEEELVQGWRLFWQDWETQRRVVRSVLAAA